MTIHQFIQYYQIRPVDAIVMRKKFLGMVDHYVLYMGVINNRHVFIANYTGGVQEIPSRELNTFLQKLVPIGIDRFPGSDEERERALRRANSRVGEKAYSYLNNNCEHFKNWVHKGEHKSLQAENFKQGALAVGFGALIVGIIGAIAAEGDGGSSA